MTEILERLQALSTAEDFFTVLDVPYDQSVLNVSRLHILKKFQEYMKRDGVADLEEEACRTACQGCLTQAYQDFLASDGVTEKLFKVFKDQQAPEASFISLDSLKGKR